MLQRTDKIFTAEIHFHSFPSGDMRPLHVSGFYMTVLTTYNTRSLQWEITAENV